MEVNVLGETKLNTLTYNHTKRYPLNFTHHYTGRSTFVVIYFSFILLFLLDQTGVRNFNPAGCNVIVMFWFVTANILVRS
jgi:hypothetical protein